MDRDLLKSALTEYFAPWVQALALEVEIFDADSGRGMAGHSDARIHVSP
ncbi:MAG: hypothetical protein ABI409_09760 [Ramlibacter sp.]